MHYSIHFLVLQAVARCIKSRHCDDNKQFSIPSHPIASHPIAWQKVELRKQSHYRFVHLLDALGRVNVVQCSSLRSKVIQNRNRGLDVRLESFSDDLDFVVGSPGFLGALQKSSDQNFLGALEIQDKLDRVDLHGILPGLHVFVTPWKTINQKLCDSRLGMGLGHGILKELYGDGTGNNLSRLDLGPDQVGHLSRSGIPFRSQEITGREMFPRALHAFFQALALGTLSGSGSTQYKDNLGGGQRRRFRSRGSKLFAFVSDNKGGSSEE
mmetsp:Transcript_32251/g.75821  ORF Transcript_32251/g.75821 Transcript_32251/m.75821 type:complete len:268 (+) Transcript_32251:135-938(+)